LTLNYRARIEGPGALNHLGVEVASTAEVLAAKERLTKAGLVTRDELNVDCCFALQDKTWITDPDGYRWEVFTVKARDTRPELTIERPAAQTEAHPETCCRS
jgi:hypothetical protein